jgi:hypothetical protein
MAVFMIGQPPSIAGRRAVTPNARIMRVSRSRASVAPSCERARWPVTRDIAKS